MTNSLKNFNIIWFFYFWRVLLAITNPLFMIIWLCPPIYTYPPLILGKLTWPQNILEVSSDSLPLIDAMGPLLLLSVIFNFRFSSDSLWRAVSLLAKYQNKLKSCKTIGSLILKVSSSCSSEHKSANSYQNPWMYRVCSDLLKAISILSDAILRRSSVEQDDLRLYWKATKIIFLEMINKPII